MYLHTYTRVHERRQRARTHVLYTCTRLHTRRFDTPARCQLHATTSVAVYKHAVTALITHSVPLQDAVCDMCMHKCKSAWSSNNGRQHWYARLLHARSDRLATMVSNKIKDCGNCSVVSGVKPFEAQCDRWPAPLLQKLMGVHLDGTHTHTRAQAQTRGTHMQTHDHMGHSRV